MAVSFADYSSVILSRKRQAVKDTVWRQIRIIICKCRQNTKNPHIKTNTSEHVCVYVLTKLDQTRDTESNCAQSTSSLRWIGSERLTTMSASITLIKWPYTFSFVRLKLTHLVVRLQNSSVYSGVRVCTSVWCARTHLLKHVQTCRVGRCGIMNNTSLDIWRRPGDKFESETN